MTRNVGIWCFWEGIEILGFQISHFFVSGTEREMEPLKRLDANRKKTQLSTATKTVCHYKTARAQVVLNKFNR